MSINLSRIPSSVGGSLFAPIFAADNNGVAGDLEASAVGKHNLAVEVVANATRAKLAGGGGNGLAGDGRGENWRL